MFRLSLLTLTLLGIFTWLVGTTRLIAGTQTSPIAPLFTNPDGTPCQRPCLFGIQPGKTARKQVLGLLQAHPLLMGEIHQMPQDDGEVIFAAQGTNLFAGKTIFLRVTGFPTVNVIAVDAAAAPRPKTRKAASQSLTSLGDMVAFLGVPDWFVRKDYGGDWYYFRRRELFALTGGGIPFEWNGQWFLTRSPTDSIVSLSISATGFVEDLGFKWCGFAIRPRPFEAGCQAVGP